jgi:hypothetical protein
MKYLDLLPVVWPVISAIASLVVHLIEPKAPRAAAFLRATGLDLPGAVRAMSRAPALENSTLLPSIMPPAEEPEDAPAEEPPPAAPKRSRRRPAKS